MFNPSREDVRRFFFSKPGAEVPNARRWKGWKTALEAALLPGVSRVAGGGERSIDREFRPEGGQPQSLPASVAASCLAEQISIDQPRGIRGLHAQLDARTRIRSTMRCTCCWNVWGNGMAGAARSRRAG
jgi:hypothetical protein